MLRQNNYRQNNGPHPLTEGGHSCPPLRKRDDGRSTVAGVVGTFLNHGCTRIDTDKGKRKNPRPSVLIRGSIIS